MATKRDYYEVLGVDKNASDADIKSTRETGKQYHPDVTKIRSKPGLRKLMRYEVLVIPKRSQYDHFGHAGLIQTAASRLWGFGDFRISISELVIFETFFEEQDLQDRPQECAPEGSD